MYIRISVNNDRPIARNISKATLPLLLLLQVQFAWGQKGVADSVNYLKSYWYNGVSLLKRPLHFTSDQWITAGGSMVFVGSMIALDEPINVPVSNWTSSGANKLGNAADVAGGAPFQLGLSTSAILIGSIAKNKPILNFGLDNLQAQVFTGGVTYLFKNLFHRARPETGEGAFSWYGPFNGWGNESFYSGHTAMAFSTANMIFLHCKRKWWVGVLSFGAATAVGVGRMQQQKHWSSDVVMGAIMGTAISTWVYKQQEKRRAVRQKIKPAFH